MTVAPFNPGQLAVPFVMPDQRAYQVAPLTGVRALSAAARREHEQACQRARAQFEQDWQREEQRQGQLDAYHREYEAWAGRERERIDEDNRQIEEIGRRLAAGEASALGEYFAAALLASGGWPDSFPRQVAVAWDLEEGKLVADWEL